VTYKRPAKLCGRCQHTVMTGWCWPDGFVCVSCVRHGVRTRGCCPGCKATRPLPGRDDAGRAVCVDCAGITTSFICSSCASEGELWFKQTCLRCSLRRRLSDIFGEKPGEMSPDLSPLVEAFASMADPWSVLLWLNLTHVRERVGALVSGAVALTHEGIDTMPGGQGREHLRGLLMVHGLLPERDRHLMAFERWQSLRIAEIEEPADRQVIHLYLAWRHLRDLTVRSAAGRLSAAAVAAARQRTNAALKLLAWLRARGTTLEACSQSDIDSWFATASNPQAAVDFLVWAMRHRRCPSVSVPSHSRSAGAPPARLASGVIERLVSDDAVATGDRVAGLLVLVLAQPVSRICALGVTDIVESDDDVRVRLGGEPVVVPEVIASLFRRHLHERAHMTTLSNATSAWLFPGRFPGDHLSPGQLRWRLRQLGVRIAGRQASLARLVAEVPSPVLAEALGYHPTTTARKAAQLGTDWAHYASLRRAGNRVP